MDRIDAMRVFVTVVSEGGFTRAADRLDLSPQLVSKYIAQLEQQLGVRLLNRTTRKISITEAGNRYYQRLLHLLPEIDDLERQLEGMQEEAKGQLRISAPVSFAIKHMTPFICDFQKVHPSVSIDLQLNDRKVDIVDEGFDIALRIGRLKSSSLIAKHIAPVRLVYCASPDYLEAFGIPENLEQLKHHRFLRYSYSEDSTYSPDIRAPSHHPELGELLTNNGDVLVEAAIRGAGIALQPTFIAGLAIADGRLKIIMQDQAPEPLGLYAVYAHRQLLASKVRAFLDFIDGYFGSTPYWDNFQLQG